MRVIGIDPGYGRLGFAVVESDGGGLQSIGSGVIETDAKLDLASRLLEVYASVGELVTRYSPDSAAIERQMFVTNRTTGLDVAKAVGVVMLRFAESSVPIFEYTPTEVKMTVSGSGHADKKQIEFMVKQILKLDSIPKLDDETDAMAVAICHAHSLRMKSLHRVK